MSCEPNVLVKGLNMNIVQCPHCGQVGLYYNNILIGFKLMEFFGFSQAIFKMDFDEDSVYFYDNKRHVVIDTCHQDINLTFSEEEFETLVDMLNQARLIIEARHYARVTY